MIVEPKSVRPERPRPELSDWLFAARCLLIVLGMAAFSVAVMWVLV